MLGLASATTAFRTCKDEIFKKKLEAFYRVNPESFYVITNAGVSYNIRVLGDCRRLFFCPFIEPRSVFPIYLENPSGTDYIC